MAEQQAILTIREYKQQIDDLMTSIGSLENGTKKYNGLLEQSTGTLDANIKQLAAQKNELADLKKQYAAGTISQTDFLKRQSELKISMSELNKTINNQQKLANASKGSYNDLSQTLSLLKNAYKQLNDEQKMSLGGKELAADINLLDQYLKETSANFGEFQRNVGNYETATVSLKGQLKELQAQMAQMLANGAKPTDAEFVNLAQNAGKIKDALNDASAATKQYANDTRGMAAVLDVAQTGVAVFGAWKSAMSLFGVESAEATKVIQTMTTVTTLLNSVQAINKALFDNSTATYKLFHKALQAVGLEQKATATATEATTLATKGLRKALISTGIGAIAVAVGLLAANWDKVTKALGLVKDKQYDANKELNKAMDAVDGLNDRLKDNMATCAANANQLTVLRDRYINAKNEFAKSEALEEATKLMNQYGIKLKDTNEYATQLVKNTPKIVEAIKMQGEAAALAAVRQELFTKWFNDRVKELTELTKKNGNSATDIIESVMYELEHSPVIYPWEALDERIAKLKTDASELISTIGGTTKTAIDDAKKAEKAETEAQKKAAKAVEERVNKQKDLNDAVQRDIDLHLELNKLDNKLSNKDKTEEELDAIDKQITGYEALAEIYKQASEDYSLSVDKRLEYAHKYEQVRIQIGEDLNKKTILNTAFLNSVEEKAEKDRIDILKASQSDQLFTLEEGYERQRKILADAYTNHEITREEYEKRSLEQELTYNVSRLNIEHQHAEELLALREQNLQKLIDEGISPESEAYIKAANEVDEAKRAVDYAYLDFKAAMLNKEVKLAEQQVKDENKALKKRIKNGKDYLKATGVIFDTVADILQEDIDNKKDAGEEERKEAEKEFNVLKAFQIGQALITGATASLEAYESAWGDKTIPSSIAKQVLAVTNMAAAIGTTAWSIAQISKAKFGENNSLDSAPSVSASTAGISVLPLLDERIDNNSLQNVQTQTSLDANNSDTRVYIVQSDITDSNKQVEIRQKNTTF